MHDNDSTAAAAAPEQGAPAQWAILDLMGHQRLAGRVTQQTFGGANLIRVDVPEVVLTDSYHRDGQRVESMEVIPAHTRSLGAAAIYSIHWVDEAAATLAAHSIRHQPINPYNLRSVLRSVPAEQRAKLLALAAPGSTEAAMLADADATPTTSYGGSDDNC